RRSQEAVAIESVLGRRVPGCGEGAVQTALRLVVRAAEDRGGSTELLAECRSHHHGDGTSDLQGTDADEEGPGRSEEQGRLDSRLQDAERRGGSSLDRSRGRGVPGSDATCRRRFVPVSERRQRHRTPDHVQDGVAADTEAREGAVLPHLRSAVDVRDAVERWWRSRRMGDAAPAPGRCEGVQEVLADEVADEARGAAEAQSRGERVGGNSGTGRLMNSRYSGTVGRSSGTVLGQFSPEKRSTRGSDLQKT